MSWRTGFALINQYTANNQWQQAVETGKKYIKKYPSNYYIGLKYAKALCETGQYQPCISLLNKMQVLPNEGSYAGRAVYRAANLYQAMEQLSRKNYRQVMRNVEASKEWPENLGVGLFTTLQRSTAQIEGGITGLPAIIEQRQCFLPVLIFSH